MLECFVKICETGSMTQAADELFITRQAVSHTMMRMEEELRTQLVERRHDGVTITQQGMYFYKNASRILNLWNETREHLLDNAVGYRKSLRIGFGRASYNFWADKSNTDFTRRFPGLELSVQTMFGDELYESLLNRQIDIAVSNSTFRSNMLSHKLLYRMPVFALVRSSDSLAQKDQLTLRDLANRNISVVSNNSTFLRDLQKYVRKEQITSNIQELKSHDVVSILRELSAIPDCVHLTADFFSDMLGSNQQFVIRKLDATESGLTKNIRAYFRRDDKQDAVLQQYIIFLKEQLLVKQLPDIPH